MSQRQHTMIKSSILVTILAFTLTLANADRVRASDLTINVAVPGTATPWLAGQPDGTPGPFGDLAPLNSPAEVDVSSLDPSLPILFSVTGSTSRDPNLFYYPLVGGDGETPGTGPRAMTDSVTAGSDPTYDLSGLTAPFSSLVGVFLNTSQTTAVPLSLSFETESQRSFLSSTPLIQQVFFVGDGLTGVGSGLPQEFWIPNGAEVLYLGLFDRHNSNNVGLLNVAVSSIPEPTTLTLTALGLFGLVARGRRRRAR